MYKLYPAPFWLLPGLKPRRFVAAIAKWFVLRRTATTKGRLFAFPRHSSGAGKNGQLAPGQQWPVRCRLDG